MERTVVVLRPIIVKTGLGKTFENILKVNNLYIIKKARWMLKPAEVSILCKMEGISDWENQNTYKKIMLEGPVEIYLLSKYGAVGEAKALIDGCMRGWKRVSQKDPQETDDSIIQKNLDSESSAFQISPFTSFNEIIDVEDFIVYHSNLEKYWKKSLGELGKGLYNYKLNEIWSAVNKFTWFFNVAAHVSQDSDWA